MGCKHYSPLVASIAETGDLVGGLLREGNVGPALQADSWIPQLVERFRQAGTQVRVRIDAGFTGNPTLAALDKANIEYGGQRSRLFIIRLCRFIRLIRMVDAFRIKKLQIPIFNHVCQVLIA